MKTFTSVITIVILMGSLVGCSGDKVEPAIPVPGQKENMKQSEMKQQGSTTPKPFDDSKKKGDPGGG